MINLSTPHVQFALDAVRRACTLAQRIQTELVVEGVSKSDMSPVTVADYAIQALVAQALDAAMSGEVLVGEESARDLRTPESAAMCGLLLDYVGREVPGATVDSICDWIDRGTGEPGKRFWTLDPVDGTKGYLRGEQYAVALALIEHGQVQFGVLGCPNLGEDFNGEAVGGGVLLVAQRGEGAWATALAGPADFLRVQVSACAEARQARIMRSVEAAHTNVDEVDHIAQHLGIEAAPVRMDSQAKYAVLASGGGEMLFRLLSPKRPDYKERIWDQAAGSIVLEEAGGRITDLYGRPLDFSQGRGLEKNTGVLATNGVLHEAGLEAIRAVCKLPAKP